MLIIVTKAQCTNQWVDGYDFAYIPITKEMAQRVLTRRKTFLEALDADDGLADMQYWDYSVNYFAARDDDGLDDLQDTSDDYMEVPDDFKLPENVEGTECDQMVIGKDGVYWTCYPKHVDAAQVSTMTIPYHEFERVL